LPAFKEISNANLQATLDLRGAWPPGIRRVHDFNPQSIGASLIVFYSNACIPKAAQIYVSLGPRMFFGPHSVVHATGPAINGNLPNLKHSRIGADGQVGVANCV
jgi:hypothetical protein